MTFAFKFIRPVYSSIFYDSFQFGKKKYNTQIDGN